MMKKFAIFLLAVLIAAGLSVAIYHYMAIPRQEGVAQLKPAKLKLYSPLPAYSSPYAVREKSRPEELIDLPKEISDMGENVHFFSLPVGKNNIFVIIQKTATDKVTAWVDMNMDDRLSDENPLSGVAQKHTEDKNYTWEYFDFGTIQLKSPTFTSAPFYFTCHERLGYIQIQPVSCMQGKIRLDNHIYQLTFIDGDFDGKIKTAFSYSKNAGYFECDTLHFIDKGYSLPWNNNDTGQTIPLGKYFHSSYKYFSIDLSADDTELHMPQVEPAMGTLAVESNLSLRAGFSSDTASQWVDFEKQIQLPAGRYQMFSGWLQYEDDTGHLWKLRPYFRENIQNGQFEIKERQTFTLNPGPPFKIKTNIEKSSDSLRIGVNLVGNEGEEYGLRLSRNTPEPTLKILNENETEIHTGQMEYG